MDTDEENKRIYICFVSFYVSSNDNDNSIPTGDSKYGLAIQSDCSLELKEKAVVDYIILCRMMVYFQCEIGVS